MRSAADRRAYLLILQQIICKHVYFVFCFVFKIKTSSKNDVPNGPVDKVLAGKKCRRCRNFKMQRERCENIPLLPLPRLHQAIHHISATTTSDMIMGCRLETCLTIASPLSYLKVFKFKDFCRV